MRVNRGRPFRRTIGVATGVLIATTATWAVTGSPGSAASDPGQGAASAFTEAVIPKDGSLAIGVTLGEALAGHTNGQAKGQSQSLDLGSIGTSLTSADCGSAPAVQPNQIPQPLIEETGQAGAAAGVTESDLGGSVTKFAKATAAPYGQSIVTSAPLNLSGLLSLGGGTSTASSGILNGDRQASATTDLSGLTLPGGISLSGLHWAAMDQSTGKTVHSGSFSIGHASIAGLPIPTNNPSATLQQLNSVLNPLGIVLSTPKVHTASGVLYVDPLQLSVVPNAARDGLTNSVILGIQPLRQQLFAAVLKAFCKADTPITVADVAIAALTGGGSFNVDLGGVQATSGSLNSNGFNLGGGPSGSGGIALGGGSSSQPSSGSVGSLGSSGSALSDPSLGGGSSSGLGSPIANPPTNPTPTPSSGQTSGSATGPARSVVTAIQPASVIKGKRGGALALVGLLGLLLLGLVAEGDRRKMRRAQHTVTFEE